MLRAHPRAHNIIVSSFDLYSYNNSIISRKLCFTIDMNCELCEHDSTQANLIQFSERMSSVIRIELIGNRTSMAWFGVWFYFFSPSNVDYICCFICLTLNHIGEQHIITLLYVPIAIISADKMHAHRLRIIFKGKIDNISHSLFRSHFPRPYRILSRTNVAFANLMKWNRTKHFNCGRFDILSLKLFPNRNRNLENGACVVSQTLKIDCARSAANDWSQC